MQNFVQGSPLQNTEQQSPRATTTLGDDSSRPEINAAEPKLPDEIFCEISSYLDTEDFNNFSLAGPLLSKSPARALRANTLYPTMQEISNILNDITGEKGKFLLNTSSLKLPPEINDEQLCALIDTGHLKNITNLDLSGIRINNTAIEKLGKMSNIRSLNLRNCTNINDSSIAHIKNLKNIHTISFKNTEISDAGVADLCESAKLVSINLSECESISDKSLVSLENQKNLKALDLSSTSVTDDGIERSSSLFNGLTLLFIANTGITDQSLSKLHSITTLKLKYCMGISNAGITKLCKSAKNISYLDLSHININIENLENISKLKKLECLDISYTDIDDLGMPIVNKMQNLRELDLSGNNVSNQGLCNLKDLPLLTSIQLEFCNRVDGEDVSGFLESSNISSVNLKGTPITNTGLKNILGSKNIKTINISECNNITDKGLDNLNSPKDIEFISLANCPNINGTGLSNFRESDKLETIVLNGCPLSEAGFNNISELKSLKTLYLSSTSASDSKISKLYKITNLSSLNLSCNKGITSESKDVFIKFENLRHLDIGLCPISYDKNLLNEINASHKLNIATSVPSVESE